MACRLLKMTGILTASAVIGLAAAASVPASAMDLRELDQERDGVRGLLILRIPLGKSEALEWPRVGLDLGGGKNARQGLEPNRFDPDTGKLLLEDDPAAIQTWPVNELVPTLPHFGPDLPEAKRKN